MKLNALKTIPKGWKRQFFQRWKIKFLFSFYNLLPAKTDSKPFEDIVKVFKDHFIRNTTYERFVFNNRAQKESESVSDCLCKSES